MEQITKKCVVWGTKACGRQLAAEAEYLGYEVLGFCSSNIASNAGFIGEKPVMSPEMLKEACLRGEADCIILGMNRRSYIEEVSAIISKEFPSNLEVLSKDSIENDYLQSATDFSDFRWEIDFNSQVSD